MEVYLFPRQGYTDAFTIPGINSNSWFTSENPRLLEDMYSEGAPEYFVDQGFYYPPASHYGYICTASESPGKWDDQHNAFGLDGQDVQYAGPQTENIPLMYYSPGFGYGQSPYNPYNPYIPGAMVAADGSYLGAPHFYSIPPYDTSSSSSAYFPIPAQSRPDLIRSNTTDTSIDSNSSTGCRTKGSILKHNLPSASSTFTSTLFGPTASNKPNYFTRVSGGTERSHVTSKQPTAHGNVMSSTLSHSTLKQILQDGNAQSQDYAPHGKLFPSHGQLKVALPPSDGVSSFGSSINGQHTADKPRSKFLYGRVPDDSKVCTDALMEQNRGPRIDKSRNQLTLKAYTSTAGNADTQRNIIIYTDLYNKDDFQVDYTSAKFFVIKSYSEDDVHKSIKYGVWSSTPNGNKKLNSAYEEAQRLVHKESGSCPIFLFFSVNASGQFCGVAEMIGPVDFHKDMDFWQQDKWSGSFPVKWHIIKDVPNPCFRHIILENNENKPVTNSRDTQEVQQRGGTEMLKVVKNYVSKTCLFDDFMYYENREKILLEEKARVVMRKYDYPFVVAGLEGGGGVRSVIDLQSSKGDVESKLKKSTSSSDKDVSAPVKKVRDKSVSEGGGEGSIDEPVLNMGTLTMNGKVLEAEVSEVVVPPAIVAEDSTSGAVLRIGSVAVKVKVKVNGGDTTPSGFLRFGSIDATAFEV